MGLFVSIASYCDPLLPATLQRAVATAAQPQRLHFGVVDQSPMGSPRVSTPPPARLSQVQLDVRDARGPCWARAIAMSLYDGEDWFLQLDAHMDFDPGWDECLVAQAQALGAPRRRLAISSYPDALRLVDGQLVRQPTTAGVLAQVVKPGHALRGGPSRCWPSRRHVVATEQALPAFHLRRRLPVRARRVHPGRALRPLAVLPRRGAGAGAAPLHARLRDLVPHAGPAGIHHLYNDAASGAPSRGRLHWDAGHEAWRSVRWWALEQRARGRLAALVAGQDLGVYGLGQERSLAQFAAFKRHRLRRAHAGTRGLHVLRASPRAGHAISRGERGP